jgi:hypothetical protein
MPGAECMVEDEKMFKFLMSISTCECLVIRTFLLHWRFACFCSGRQGQLGTNVSTQALIAQHPSH